MDFVFLCTDFTIPIYFYLFFVPFSFSLLLETLHSLPSPFPAPNPKSTKSSRVLVFFPLFCDCARSNFSLSYHKMMYGDPQQQQNQPPPPQQGGEFQRGPPPPQMMRQPSASSTTLNSEYHHSAPPPQMPPPYDGRIIIRNLFCLQFCICFSSNYRAL